MRKISQREAHRLRKRVYELEQEETSRRSCYAQQWPGGIEITRTQWGQNDAVPIALRTARRLRHAVVAIGDDDGTVRFIALPLPRV